jgi:hypothetical protein
MSIEPDKALQRCAHGFGDAGSRPPLSRRCAPSSPPAHGEWGDSAPQRQLQTRLHTGIIRRYDEEVVNTGPVLEGRLHRGPLTSPPGHERGVARGA